jgi:hypothetical protein
MQTDTHARPSIADARIFKTRAVERAKLLVAQSHHEGRNLPDRPGASSPCSSWMRDQRGGRFAKIRWSRLRMRPAMVALRPGKRRDVVRTSVGAKRSPEMSRSEDVKWIGQRQLTRLTVGWTVGLRLSGEMQPGGPDEGVNSGDTSGAGTRGCSTCKPQRTQTGLTEGHRATVGRFSGSCVSAWSGRGPFI